MRGFLASALIVAALPAAASAQSALPHTSRGFVSVQAGLQSGKDTTTWSTTRSVYDEQAEFRTSSDFDGGPLFGFAAGVHVFDRLSIGLAMTRVSDTQTGTATVSIPNPLQYNAPRTATATLPDLKHAETAFHLAALYTLQLNERFDVTVGAGPTFFNAKHDFVTALGFTESSAPYTTVAASTPTVVSASKGSVGFHVLGEAGYAFTDMLGATAFVRYANGSAAFDVDGKSTDVKLGGMQFGAGLRIRF